MSDDILKLLDQEEGDAYNCGLVISNAEGFNLLQGNYDVLKAELTVQPQRFWHQGTHNLENILNKYRTAGYRVEAVGEDEGNRVYTIIRAHLLLSSETLVRMMLHWINR